MLGDHSPLAMNHATGDGSFLLVVTRHVIFARTFKIRIKNEQKKNENGRSFFGG